MTKVPTNTVARPSGQLVRKFLVAASLAIGLAAALQPSSAEARGFGHGWGGHWGGWGPAWGISFYAPLYGWGPYPYGYPYPYYYGGPIVAPLAAYPDYGTDVWPASAGTYHQQAYTQALSAPIGQEIAWSGGGVSGTITPVRDGRSGDRYCRELLQKVVIDGHHHQAYGAACQTPDGRWQAVPDILSDRYPAPVTPEAE